DEHEHHDDDLARGAEIIRDPRRQTACAECAGHFEYDVDQIEAAVLEYGDRHDAGKHQHDGKHYDGDCSLPFFTRDFAVDYVLSVASAAECDEEQSYARVCRRAYAAACCTRARADEHASAHDNLCAFGERGGIDRRESPAPGGLARKVAV